MTLFFNVFITGNRHTGPNRVDRVDLFKYALSSYATINRITDVIIYCQLDTQYQHREQELRDFINNRFCHATNVSYYNFSPDNQAKWQEALLKSPCLNEDEITIYGGNDDHIFTDYTTEGLYEGIALMEKEPKDQITTLHFSSWPEAISTIHYNFPYTRPTNLYLRSEAWCELAMQVVNSTYFKHIFFNLNMGDNFVRRTDTINSGGWYPLLGGFKHPSKVPHPKAVQFVPLREMGRHFDSYFHVGMPYSNCPPLTLPEGFFDSNIKINYGPGRMLGYYNVNPLAQNYYLAGDPDGCDDKKMIEDLPVFWKDRVSEIQYNIGQHTRAELFEGRNKAHRDLITTPHFRGYQKQTYEGVLPLPEEMIAVGFRHD